MRRKCWAIRGMHVLLRHILPNVYSEALAYGLSDFVIVIIADRGACRSWASVCVRRTGMGRDDERRASLFPTSVVDYCFSRTDLSCDRHRCIALLAQGFDARSREKTNRMPTASSQDREQSNGAAQPKPC